MYTLSRGMPVSVQRLLAGCLSCVPSHAFAVEHADGHHAPAVSWHTQHTSPRLIRSLTPSPQRLRSLETRQRVGHAPRCLFTDVPQAPGGMQQAK